MTNFDFLFGEKKFSSFAGASAAAEKIYGIDTAACAVNVRRAAELAVKWMYETDSSLPAPKRDQLAALTGASEFRALVGHDNTRGLDYIRRVGNNAAHNPESVTQRQAELALRSLYAFACFLSERYASRKITAEFDVSLLDPEAELVTEAFDNEDIRRLIAENRALKRQLNMRRDSEDAPPPLSEAETRRMYIEADLAYAGWRAGVDLFSEFRVDGMPGKTGVGYVDYILCGDDGVPLALVETQATSRDIAVGRQQAKLYADSLEKQFGRRPVIFLSSGFDTRVWFDTESPERRVGGFYTKADLLRAAALHSARRMPLEEDFAGCRTDRPYQADALRALADAFCRRRERTVFLSMAPGTGKTRAALNLIGLLRRCRWIENVLYLTDNDLLTAQAMREFAAAFPDACAARLGDPADLSGADTVFAAFDDILAEADETLDKAGMHVFTAGRFDLVICDEISRAAAERYADVFAAFDAPLLAMTSVPEEEMDPAMCDMLGAAPGRAAFTYPHRQAVTDGWLAGFTATDAHLSFLENGIRSASLRGAERSAYRDLFGDGAYVPNSIRPAQLFVEYYNTDTVHLALKLLEEHGLHRDGVLGKTIIFTKNHAHSEMVYEQWGRLYPSADPHLCRVIDTETNYVQSLVSSFADVGQLPRVAVSHDLLLDGIDIPPVENLVFFLRAPSRAMFWRMLGRGMRRCGALPDGKPRFYVLDLCGNFRAFAGDTPEDDGEPLPVRSRVFQWQVRLTAALQTLEYSESCAQMRAVLVRALRRQIAELDHESFGARRHLASLERFSAGEAFDALTPRDVSELTGQIAPLILPDGTDASCAAFDEQMYALLTHRAQHTDCEEESAVILRTAGQLSALASHPRIAQKKKLLHRILCNGFLKKASLPELEEARRELQPLVRLIKDKNGAPIRTCFTDRLLCTETVPDSYFTVLPEVQLPHDAE